MAAAVAIAFNTNIQPDLRNCSSGTLRLLFVSPALKATNFMSGGRREGRFRERRLEIFEQQITAPGTGEACPFVLIAPSREILVMDSKHKPDSAALHRSSRRELSRRVQRTNLRQPVLLQNQLHQHNLRRHADQPERCSRRCLVRRSSADRADRRVDHAAGVRCPYSLGTGRAEAGRGSDHRGVAADREVDAGRRVRGRCRVRACRGHGRAARGCARVDPGERGPARRYA